MTNDANAINELVTKTAEANQAETKTDTGNNQQQNNEGADKGSDADAAAQAAAKAETEKSAAEAAKVVDDKKNTASADKYAELLKELGVDSVDALKEKLKPKEEAKVLTKEEQEKEDALYEAELQKFAVEKGNMKLDDFHQLKTLKSKQDAELVFDDYLTKWKEENSEETEDIEEKAKADFESEYSLNSANEKTKERGVAKLARDAKDIRTPLESKYEEVKDSFDSEREFKKAVPVFEKNITEIINSFVPKKVEWFKGKEGEEDSGVDVELTDDEVKEITEEATKRLKNPVFFNLLKDGKIEETKNATKEIIETLSERKVRERANVALADKFFKRGAASGSNQGAENSFAVNQGKAGTKVEQAASKSQNEKAVLDQFGKK